MTVRAYDITDERDFINLGGHFAQALRTLSPLIKQGTRYYGELLYHPLHISVLGPVGAGKSSFIRAVGQGYFQGTAQETSLSVPSATGERNIMAWMRWEQPDGSFEIRSHDDLVLQSLYARRPEVCLPAIEKPHISFREHASTEFQKYSPVIVRLAYNDNGCRQMRIEVNSDNDRVTNTFDRYLPEPLVSSRVPPSFPQFC